MILGTSPVTFLDISDPQNPNTLQQISNSYSTAITIDRKYIKIAIDTDSDFAKLQIYDISNVSNPVLVADGGNGFTDVGVLLSGIKYYYQNSISSWYSTNYDNPAQGDIFEIVDSTPGAPKIVNYKAYIDYFVNFITSDDLNYIFGISVDDPSFPYTGWLVVYDMRNPLIPSVIYNGTAINQFVFTSNTNFLPDLKFNKARTILFVAYDGIVSSYSISGLNTNSASITYINVVP